MGNRVVAEESAASTIASRQISKLILGTVQLGMPYGINNTTGQPSEGQGLNILAEAFEQGVRTADTADGYGTAAELLGAFHAKGRKFRVITKFRIDERFASLESGIKNSIRRLGLETIYCLMFHRFGDLLQYPESLRELVAFKNRGLIDRIGVSVYTTDEFARVLESNEIDVIQFPFNLLDNFSQRGGLMERAKRAGKLLHTRSVFLQGLFFKHPDDIPDRLAPLKTYLQKIHSLAKESNVEIQDLALHYALQQPMIDGVLFGVETLEQLNMNLDVARKDFDSTLLGQIDAIRVQETELLNPVNWKL